MLAAVCSANFAIHFSPSL